jgi:ABC-type branched-subunit amino acid transport system substrate-binding protein
LRIVRLLAWILAAVGALAAPAPDAEKLRLERGRKIYVEGASPSGATLTALLADSSVEVPATSVPCAGCHGRDGRGRPEGGVIPTELTWDNLTKPYGIIHPSGRKTPPYDDRLVKRAVTMGIDSAGNPIHVVMPRYRLSLADMDDLLAYMKILGHEVDPGVGAAALHIGLILPPPGSLSPMASAVRSALSARFEQVNREGGLYGRKLELKVVEIPGPPEQRKAWAADFLERESIFASVGSFFFGADAVLASLFAEKQIPAIAPFTLYPKDEVPPNRYVFYLLPGVEAEAQALVRYTRSWPDLAETPPAAAIVAPGEAALNGPVAALERAITDAGWPAPIAVRYSRQGFGPREIGKLTEAKADPVFFLGSGAETRSLAESLFLAEWTPRLLVTGMAADASLYAVPLAFEGRLFVGLPSQPGGPVGDAADRYRKLAAAGLGREHLTAQLSALAAAEILIEALKRSGRDVTREKLVEQLETLRSFETGYAPPVTYAAGRRLGARGAYIVRIDLKERRLVTAGGWVEVE